MSKRLNFEAEIEIEVRDKQGKLIEKRRFKSHSWVSNFLRALRGLNIDGARSQAETLTATGGGTFSYPYLGSINYPILRLDAGAGDDRFGLLIGTGTTAVSPDDYNLASKITEGTGTNQMNYGGVTVEGLTAITNGYQFRVIRTATNNSGADINVNEVGLIAYERDYSEVDRFFLIARDVLPSTVVVSAGSTITVRYIISFTVS